MKMMGRAIGAFAVVAVWLLIGSGRPGDDLRNIKRGEPIPTVKFGLTDGSTLDTESLKGSVVVFVCLAAEQTASERAAEDSAAVAAALNAEPVQLIHVTADTDKKASFDSFREKHHIGAHLALDADRAFLSKLGVIAFPTTIVVDKQHRLSHVILLHDAEYKDKLQAYVGHALGTISDARLQEMLAGNSPDRSPQRAAAAHRAMARIMREKGDLDSARTELNKAMALDGQSTEIALDLAEVHLAAKGVDEAEPLVARVLKDHPDDRRARRLSGEVLYRRDKLEEARAALEQSMGQGSGQEIAHYFLGRIAERKGEKDKAIEHYREALRAFVHDPWPERVKKP